MRLLREKGEVFNYECRALSRDGSTIWTSKNAKAVLDKDGKVLHYQGFVTDITERKRAEEENRRFRTISDNAVYGKAIADLQGNLLYINPFLAKIHGYTPEELAGLHFSIFHSREQMEVADRLIESMMREGHFVPTTVWHRHKDGTEFPMLMSGVLIKDDNGNPQCIAASVLDMTAQHQAARKLAESEKILREIMEGTLSGYWDWDLVNNTEYLSPSFKRMFGYEDHEMESSPEAWQKIILPEDLPGVFDIFDRHVKSRGREPFFNEVRYKHKNGSTVWVACSGRVIEWAADGTPMRMVGCHIDITKRKKAEEELLEQKDLLTAIYRNAPLVLMVVDSERRVQQVNGFAFQFAGRDMEEMIGLRGGEALRCVHALDDPQGCGFGDFCGQCVIRNTLLDTLRTGKTHLMIEAPYYFQKNADETLELTFLASTTPLTFKNERMALMTLQDITERKQIEKQLKYLSFHDQLTGLYNRTCFEYEMQRLSKSREHPITVVCMDVDGLKMVNDTLGHAQGDKVLKQCADLLLSIFRKSEIVARTGGDEFAALLPKTDMRTGQEIVSRIRTVIDEFNQQAHSSQIPLSISIGFSVAKNADDDLFSIFKEADDLMYRDKLSKDVTHRSRIMRSLLATLKERDFMSHDNAQRMEHLCRLVGKKIDLSEKQLSDLTLLVHLHDIGNAGVPDHILFKKGLLTEEEWRVIYQHPEKGYRIVKASTDFAEIGDLILKHHERWDGEGYPLRLEGEEIPIECRVFSIIDAYDAMTGDRPYRKAVSVADAKKEIEKCSGTMFDPHLVEKFIQALDEID